MDIGSSAHADGVVSELRAKLEDHSRRRARRAGWSKGFVSTGLAPLDAALPHQGLPCGAITEIFSDGLGVGAMTLALRIAGRCMAGRRHSEVGEFANSDPRYVGRILSAASLAKKAGKTHPIRPAELDESPVSSRGGGKGEMVDQRCAVLVDTMKDFYPPAASQHGIAFDRFIVIRTSNKKDAFWAAEQSLRCPAVAVVIAPLTHLEEHSLRRLQLAAESSGCVGLILRLTPQRVKSFAAVQMLIEGVGGDEQSWLPPLIARDARRCRITLLRVREGMPTGPLLVDLHDETGDGSLYPIPSDRSVAKLA